MLTSSAGELAILEWSRVAATKRDLVSLYSGVDSCSGGSAPGAACVRRVDFAELERRANLLLAGARAAAELLTGKVREGEIFVGVALGGDNL